MPIYIYIYMYTRACPLGSSNTRVYIPVFLHVCSAYDNNNMVISGDGGQLAKSKKKKKSLKVHIIQRKKIQPPESARIMGIRVVYNTLYIYVDETVYYVSIPIYIYIMYIYTQLERTYFLHVALC